MLDAIYCQRVYGNSLINSFSHAIPIVLYY